MATYLPEARKNIVEMLENAMTAALTEVQEQSFGEPYADANIELMMEAVAATVNKLARRSHTHAALMQTFALSLLDNVEK